LPPPLHEPLERRYTERDEVPKRVATARDHAVVGLRELVERHLPRRVSRMRERAAGRDVEAVHALLLEPPADLDRLLERVPVTHPRIDVFQVLERADLELHVIVVADLSPDRPYDVEREARTVLE
jgi:hypothetical protein